MSTNYLYINEDDHFVIVGYYLCLLLPERAAADSVSVCARVTKRLMRRRFILIVSDTYSNKKVCT